METLVAASEQREAERDELLAQIASSKAARDQALATVAEQGETIERLTIGLNDARQVAADAIVGKSKDRLAIDGKDAQLADQRLQIERGVVASVSESNARLAVQMALIGAVTARDNFAVEAKDLRTQLAADSAERSSLRAEMEVLRAWA
ncbi:hypothetical protein [Undibacterium sp.]|uniref:hypothetical protein n=1 Tax=Undibacterium sp. TaxID=1914977 RepID=UPI00374CBF84